MRIGYICNQGNCVSGASNGIRMQALVWRDELVKRGHEVILINAWDIYDWNSFDLVHAFSFGDCTELLYELKAKGVYTVCSPIIDSNQNKFLYKLNTKWGSRRLRLFSPGYRLRQHSANIDMFLARTVFEADYIHQCVDIPSSKIEIVPLSYRCNIPQIDYSKKENFCLHVSSITQERKNVMRLIQAAIKYKFQLVLVGSIGTPQQFAPFKKLIDENENISCLGFVPDNDLEVLYSKAKVFALPSICEGVGLVALEAAIHGCGVVVTNIGGPKEYYPDDLVQIINPYSVDEIGKAIINAMENTNQPELSSYVATVYSLSSCVDRLERIYENVCQR